MKRQYLWGGLLFMGCLLTPAPILGAPEAPRCTPQEALILGLYEPLQVLSANIQITGLVDTGAEISSIDRTLAQYYKLDAPVKRQIYIRTAHGVEQRDIVELRVKLKGKVLRREFTLSNRQPMKQKVLLGRNLLQGFFIDLNR